MSAFFFSVFNQCSLFIWFLDHIFWRYVSRSRKARSERKIRLSKLNRWDFWVLDFECVSWEPGGHSWPLRQAWGWDSLRNGWSSYLATGYYRKITGQRVGRPDWRQNRMYIGSQLWQSLGDGSQSGEGSVGKQKAPIWMVNIRMCKKTKKQNP